MKDYERLKQEIIRRGSLTLSEEERSVLEQAPESDASVWGILGAHAFNAGDHVRAIEITRRLHAANPTSETASNLVSALSRANQVEEAIRVAEAPDSPLKPVLQASYLSELYGRIGAWDKNRHWSRRALDLKEAEARHLVRRPAIKTAAFDIDRPARNIISFSLWGDNPRYLEGALRNCIVARHLYPGWTPRFYIDDSLPTSARRDLAREGAQLRTVPSMPANRFGLFWRFLVEDDPEVDFYVVRDADSVLNIRERVAVADWLDSGQPFHVMRDFVTHSELVLAGMWGAHRGNIPQMGKRILAFAMAREKVLNSRVDDQLFLRQEVWPWMRGRAFVQDSAFGHGDSAPFDRRFPLPGRMHIGQDDHASRIARARQRRDPD
ncbi:hypothetical protein [Maritimibacter sp. DP1N21-5]|uniref:hypothetical protein n=1 Tax=Maritimibacter sp. DP1N21-5 TaxID=2836867 RepID=UPI001C4831BF|nr:hypothetical protein [Maritimibacter sp. DP1N21-5]MBV7409109.1 hypothetical protein [Maritimibacter sp. DP1N21-5]